MYNRVKTNVVNVFAMIVGLTLTCIILSWIAGGFESDIGYVSLSAIFLSFTSIMIQGIGATRRIYLQTSILTQMFKDSTLITSTALMLTWVWGYTLMHWTMLSLLNAIIVYLITQILFVYFIKRTTVTTERIIRQKVR